MAESMVEEPLGFFCHRCWVEIRPVLPSYLCPHCSSGFIEELDTTQTEQPAEADNSMDDFSIFIEPTAVNFPFPLRHLSERINQPGRHGQRSALPRPMTYHLRDDRSDNPLRRGLDAIRGIRDHMADLQRVDFYTRDYAWNREGLDAIVTHLLNQMEVSGPPPLAKERIDEIPVVNIAQQQVDASLQCPVCWEDFRIEETVRKLMCDHYFHENCIIPWLELHGTCPVCRKWLLDDGNGDETSQDGFGHQESNGANERQRPGDLSSQLETLLSAGLESLPDLAIDVDVPPDSASSSHNMSCG